jgi:lysophospholipase L1-like esterase
VHLGVSVWFRHALWVGVVCAAACTQTSTQPTPTPPVPDPPKITCPPALTEQSRDGQTLAVTYPEVTIAGGAAPVSTVCAPARAESFPIGSTVVTCTATDAQSRTDACTFTVTVQPPPRISATRFVVFGDSMSDGVLGFAPFAVGDPGPPVGYAFKFRTLLMDRYTAQTFSVTDEGVGGETVIRRTPIDRSVGVERLPLVLNRDAPEALLLLEGVNDLNGGTDKTVTDVVDGLKSMVRMARGRGIVVFVGTLLPQRPGGRRAFSPGAIVPINTLIRSMAASEGAVLVDLYPAFDGQVDVLLGADGLHPNDAGYQKMAETFFAAVRARLEVPQTMPSILGFSPWPSAAR